MTGKQVDAEQLTLELHDQRILVDEVREEAGRLIVPGFIQQGRERFRFHLAFSDVRRWEIRDEAGVGTLPIYEFVYDSGAFEIPGNIPVSMTVETPLPYGVLEVDGAPFEVHPWFRPWR
ncbi:hypothetical protein [Streptomyces sp. NBC_01304]|uniref:hypothetical protein n=1 Tax=Streptomyces sp. NBC_01304 TaxID=2903818 RepID=UPI002E12D6F8|nr:hypothetical protein OG430_41925 [Streptomyces sp. NBC_01304]